MWFGVWLFPKNGCFSHWSFQNYSSNSTLETLYVPWIIFLVDIFAHVESDEHLLNITCHGGIVEVERHDDEDDEDVLCCDVAGEDVVKEVVSVGETVTIWVLSVSTILHSTSSHCRRKMTGSSYISFNPHFIVILTPLSRKYFRKILLLSSKF